MGRIGRMASTGRIGIVIELVLTWVGSGMVPPSPFSAPAAKLVKDCTGYPLMDSSVIRKT
jgi:hypothetical protein